MTAGNDARTYAAALEEHVGLVSIYRQAIEDKVAVMVEDEEADATAINEQMHFVEAAQLSLAGRMQALDDAIAAQLSEDEPLRPLVLAATSGANGISYRTVNEGDRPQWDFVNSYDPEGVYTFGTGLEVKWAKVSEDAPDLEHVVFGDTIPWLLWPTANLSVTADEEYEYEVWVETPDGRRSDLDTQVPPSGEDDDEENQFPVIEKVTFKVKVRNSSTPAAPGLLTAPSTLRKAYGFYIGADPFRGASHVLNDRIKSYESKLGIPSNQTSAWYHNYISGGQGWSVWTSTARKWLEVMKVVYDAGGTTGGRKFYLSVPPWPKNPMTSSDAGWATLRANGFTSDPKTWAAAAGGAYDYYYKWLGEQIEQIWGDDADAIALSYAWECNGTWYHFSIMGDSSYNRNTATEVHCRNATTRFHDRVHEALHASGHRVHITRNIAGGGIGNVGSTRDQNGWAAWKNSIPTPDTVSDVTGRYPVDLFTIDCYQNWWLQTATSTNMLLSLNGFSNWLDDQHPTIPYGIQETSTSMVIRDTGQGVSGGSTTLNGSQAFPRGTVTVASTASFPNAGFFKIGGKHYKYTGKTGTTFTGCTAAEQTAITHAGGAAVKESKKVGGGDDANWWEWSTDWAEGKRAAGRLVIFMSFDSDNAADALYGTIEPKSWSPTLYHMNSSPVGLYGNGTGASKAKLIAELGGDRSLATS